MAKNSNQKQKLIRLLQILEEKTDDNHKLNTNELIAELLKYDINAERKSIYSDIDTLVDLGYDIEHDTSKNGGYYIASRKLDKQELMILVDAVSASKFITQKKSRELIKKLESFLSRYEALELDREVFVNNRIKQDNESIYYYVDDIHNAISGKKKLRFQYCEFNIEKQLVPRHDGKIYIVSPLSLTWDNEKYYLIAYDDKIKEIRHYRVDKMMNLVLDKDPISSDDAIKNFDVASYTDKTFGMYGGSSQFVELEFEEKSISIIIDRFGKDIAIRKDKNGHYKVRKELIVSAQFFGWIASLGGEIRISAPDVVKTQYIDFLNKEISLY